MPARALVQSAVVGGGVHPARISAGSARPAQQPAVKLSRSSAAGRQAAPPRRQGRRCGPGAPEQFLHRRCGRAAVLGQCALDKGQTAPCSPRTAPYRLPLGTAQCNKINPPMAREHRAPAARLPAECLRRVVDDTQQRRKVGYAAHQADRRRNRKDRDARRAQCAFIIEQSPRPRSRIQKSSLPAGAHPLACGRRQF